LQGVRAGSSVLVSRVTLSSRVFVCEGNVRIRIFRMIIVQLNTRLADIMTDYVKLGFWLGPDSLFASLIRLIYW